MAALGLSVTFGRPAHGAGGLIGGNYALNFDQSVDRTATGTTDNHKFKHVLNLKYRGFISPIVENEVTFRIEQEVGTNIPNTIRLFPTINLGYKGSYWNAGGKRIIEESNEPGKTTKISDSYFIELFYRPPKSTLPDFKGKVTLDKDFQEGITDSERQGIVLSSIYRPNDWLSLQGDFSKNTTKDKLRADNDTEDRKTTGTFGIRRIISDKVKVDVEYKVDVSRGATLLSSGGTTNPKEDQTHTVKNLVSFRPFRDTSLDGTYDFNLKQNMVSGEHTITNNAKVTGTQKIGEPFTFKGEFSRNVTEAAHTADDNKKTDDSWSADLTAALARQLNLTFRLLKRNSVEEHFFNVASNSTSGSLSRSASWSGQLFPFWAASASYDKTETTTKEVKTEIDTTYSLGSTLAFKTFNLTLDPLYNIALKNDLVAQKKSETRDLKVKLAWKILSTNNINAKIDHTYGRKSDTAAGNIQRTDSTTGNVVWMSPFPGWLFGFDMTRSATDTSNDDLPPDVTSSFTFKADYNQTPLSMGTNVKYDRKKLSDDSMTFDARAGWTTRAWNANLSYSYRKTFSAALSEGYSISFAFSYTF